MRNANKPQKRGDKVSALSVTITPMTRITTSKKAASAQGKDHVRLELKKGKDEAHRFIERKDGTLAYSMSIGAEKGLPRRKFISLVRSIIKALEAHQVEKAAIDASALVTAADGDTEWVISTFAENVALAGYQYTAYKSKQRDKKTLKEVILCGELTATQKKALERGIVVGAHANLARDIANTTARDLAPLDLAKEAQKAAKGLPITVKVLGEKELAKLNMNLILAVGQGSMNESKFIIMEYWGAGRPTGEKTPEKLQPIVFAGKGITYDTGGLNLKPSGFMHDMHMDMSGGSTVIAAITCAAKLGLKRNIVGLIPSAENAISAEAMRPGDIITSMSGKTVEVLNTDAEGRMVLADALTYAARYEPKVVLDVATLTGAALVALGQHASAFFTKDRALQETIERLGEQSGDYLWPLPLWDEYQQYIKSNRADLSNISTSFSRFGGAIEGAAFLANFAPACPWAHLDIAPRMEATASDKLSKGSTGEPVRFLVRFAEEY